MTPFVGQQQSTVALAGDGIEPGTSEGETLAAIIADFERRARPSLAKQFCMCWRESSKS